MASTIDRSLVDSINYRVGAQLVLITAADAQTESSTDESSGAQTLTVTGYNAPPVQELEQVEGIDKLSRVGEYDGRLLLRGKQITGTVLGIDRAGLAAVTRYREDYSDVPLANMMNDLADTRTGVVISQRAADENGLIIGQEIEFQVNALGEWQNAMRAPIVGIVEYFPTLDPSEGFFLITNIDPIFEMTGSPLPYNVWLTLKPGYTIDQVLKNIQAISFPVLRWLSPELALQEAQAQPARRGVLGFLSIGFVAAIALTLIGAVIQSVSSFRAQAAQLGSLRAMGLGSFSVLIYMVLLQGMTAASGILSGTTIGVGTTLLFLPLLDFSGGLPPYLVRVAWDEIVLVYLIFAGVLFFVTMFVSLVLSREQLSAIVRLGES
jgi:putative ABC transport system permease protein